jgi:putative DNA primase/helicase
VGAEGRLRANGKSTFINLLAWLLGDYATTSPMDTFVVHHTEPHPTNVAKLHGARLVVAQETEKGRRWDEAKLKALTGGDVISARFMRGDYFDFRPTFKLFIVGNHKPRLENVDEAMRRRLLLVPFTVQIPAEERDPNLPERLKEEAPAILRWAIAGCLEWQSTGLAPPKIVTDATDAYFADQDMFGQWMEDCIERTAPTAFVKIGEVYASWKTWCDSRNHRPGGVNSLSEELHERRGISRARVAGGARGFAGISLKWESTRQ